MKFVKNQEGFTLVEIIVALTILMIFLFSFMTLFTTSITGIFGAGEKTSALFTAQKDMDNAIDGGPNNDEAVVTHYVYFDGDPIKIDGKLKEIPYDYDGRYTGTLKYFYPEPVPEDN